MAADISHLVAAICPDVFCEPKLRGKVKTMLNQAIGIHDRLAYLNAAKAAEPAEPNAIAIDALDEINLFQLPGQRSPIQQHTLTLDDPDEPFEALYFNLLEDLKQREGWKASILVDTVNGSPGTGFHSEMSRQIIQQQNQAHQLLSRMHIQVRTLLQHWQKWREQKERLRTYETARGDDPVEKQSALDALMIRWRRLSETDVESPEYVGKVKDFDAWLKLSEQALRQRLAIDRQLLVNELQFLKLQSLWVKPYLPQVRRADTRHNPELVTAFNTALFELVLLVELPSEIETNVQQGHLPKMLLNKKYRRARPVLVIELKLRAVPERTRSGSHAFRGKAEFKFTSYALNEAELAVLQREIARNDFGEIFGMLDQSIPGTLEGLMSDLDELLEESPGQPAQKKPDSADTNPFVALFSWFKSPAKNSGSAFSEPLRPDTNVEKVLRSFTLLEARRACLEIYNVQKQRLRMASGEFQE